MRLARRAHDLAESATMRVTRKAAELRAAGRDVIGLGAGEPDFPSPPEAVAAAVHALEGGFTRYTAAAGTPALRAAVAKRYADAWSTPWTAAETVICVGAKAALFQLTMALVEDGDEVVIPIPAWVTFAEQVRFAGGNPVFVPTVVDDRFTVHADAVIAAIGPRTKMVLLNTPSNPTGGVVPAEDLRRIAEACAERDIVLLSDETYDRFLYDGAEHASAAALATEHPDHVVVVGSFSKTYAMTGWRLGWALGPAKLITKVIALQSHATSNPTSFAMPGAEVALREAEDSVRTMVAEFEQRRDLVTARLAAMPGVRCAPPAGAFYVLPDVSRCYRPGRQGSIELAEFLLEAAGVAVVPGIAFHSDDHIRISFAAGRDDLENALERMAGALAKP